MEAVILIKWPESNRARTFREIAILKEGAKKGPFLNFTLTQNKNKQQPTSLILIFKHIPMKERHFCLISFWFWLLIFITKMGGRVVL